MTPARRNAGKGVQRRVLYDPDWLTVQSVADRLSVSAWQVRKWLEAGQFDEIAVLGPKLTRISKGAYDRFVAKNRQASA